MISLCPTDISLLPFANRLARWPDAWLLPLFPLLLRLLYAVCRGIRTTIRAENHEATTVSSFISMTALRRLGYYIILLNFRGWILYVGLNAVEDLIVRPVDSTTCWYHAWLRDGQPQCFGRVFDFSDHIVLYYAQILPVALFEVLHSLECPYWARTKNSTLPYASRKDSRLVTISRFLRLEHLLPLGLCAGMLYLYFITCLGVYKTALFFHTGLEVVVGFLISMSVHIPLGFIQCSDHMDSVRDFLFATASQYQITKYKSLT
jgi:hypothetical protein